MFLKDFSRGMYIGSALLTALKNSRQDDVTELMHALCWPGLFIDITGYRETEGVYEPVLGPDWTVSLSTSGALVAAGSMLTGSDTRVATYDGNQAPITGYAAGDYIIARAVPTDYPVLKWEANGNSLTAIDFDPRGYCEAGMKVLRGSSSATITGVSETGITLNGSIGTGSFTDVVIGHRMITPLQNTMYPAYGDYKVEIIKSNAKPDTINKYEFALAQITSTDGAGTLKDLRFESIAYLKTLMSRETQLSMVYLLLSGIWKDPNGDENIDLHLIHEQGTDAGTNKTTFVVNSDPANENDSVKFTIDPTYGQNSSTARGRFFFGDGTEANSYVLPRPGGTFQMQDQPAQISAIRSTQMAEANVSGGTLGLTIDSNVFSAVADGADITTISEAGIVSANPSEVGSLSPGSIIYIYAKGGDLTLSKNVFTGLPAEMEAAGGLTLKYGEVACLVKTGIGQDNSKFALVGTFALTQAIEILVSKAEYYKLIHDLYHPYKEDDEEGTAYNIVKYGGEKDISYLTPETFGRLKWLERILYVDETGKSLRDNATYFNASETPCVLQRLKSLEDLTASYDDRIEALNTRIDNLHYVEVPLYSVTHMWNKDTGVYALYFTNNKGNDVAPNNQYRGFCLCNGAAIAITGGGTVVPPDLRGRMIIGVTDMNSSGVIQSNTNSVGCPSADSSVPGGSPTTPNFSVLSNSPYGGTSEFYIKSNQTPYHFHKIGTTAAEMDTGDAGPFNFPRKPGIRDTQKGNKGSNLPIDQKDIDPLQIQIAPTSHPISDASESATAKSSVMSVASIKSIQVMPPFCGMMAVMRYA